MSGWSVFQDVKLPNATTWFYASMLLAVALFFKFSRFLSVRNWDVVSLFLLVPGLLLAVSRANSGEPVVAPDQRWVWAGYLWLMVGSAYFMGRCLVDLALVRRPALKPNLNLSGLAWLGGALFVSLVSVAIRHQEGTPEKVGKGPAGIDQAKEQLESLVDKQTAAQQNGIDTSFWVERGLAIFAHAAIVAGLIFVGRRHFQDAHSGVAAATFYLLLPYSAFHVGQVHHVMPAALVVWVVATYRWPTLAGGLLGLAAGTVYVPALLFPLWLGFYWRRGMGRFAASFLVTAGLCLALTGLFLWIKGGLDESLSSALSDLPWKEPKTEGFWQGYYGTGVHWGYRIPIFIAFLAFVLTTAIWPSPKNLAHVTSLSAGLFIGVQFWYADKGGVYVLWYLPLLLLMVFRPNLAERRPPPIAPESDWLARSRKTFARIALWVIRAPQPLARIH